MTAAATPQSAVGLRHSESMVVAERHTVPQVADWPGFVDMPPVLATAMMVGFMEQTCVMALRALLAPGQGTVGTHVDMSHVAATPVGMRVSAEVELIEVAGRKLRFKVLCRDEREVIGEGAHERVVVDAARFLQKAAEKAGPPGASDSGDRKLSAKSST